MHSPQAADMSITHARERLYEDLKPLALAPLWSSIHDLVPPSPRTPMQPARWRYEDVRPLLMRAGQVITAEEAVRRVLILENPGAPGSASVTSTLYAGLQLILPGEIAPAHRHTQSAFRFIVEGEGAFTAVGGERFMMRPGDLILTPGLEWHDHGNEGASPVIWLDGLDIPIVRTLAAGFAENGVSAQQATITHPGTNAAVWGSGLRPRRSADAKVKRVERFMYPYREWRNALETFAASGAPDTDGYVLEFTNPLDGQSVLPTMSGFCHLIPAGLRTRRQRRTDGTVFSVVEGEGSVTSGEQTFAVSPRDTFVVPSWVPYEIEARSKLVLFSYSDRAIQERLGLWRCAIE